MAVMNSLLFPYIRKTKSENRFLSPQGMQSKACGLLNPNPLMDKLKRLFVRALILLQIFAWNRN